MIFSRRVFKFLQREKNFLQRDLKLLRCENII